MNFIIDMRIKFDKIKDKNNKKSLIKTVNNSHTDHIETENIYSDKKKTEIDNYAHNSQIDHQNTFNTQRPSSVKTRTTTNQNDSLSIKVTSKNVSIVDEMKKLIQRSKNLYDNMLGIIEMQNGNNQV